MTMTLQQRSIGYLIHRLLPIFVLAMSTSAHGSMDPPSGPTYSADGNYTITFNADIGSNYCSIDLEEKVLGRSYWHDVRDTGYGILVVQNKSPGIYEYRVFVECEDYYGENSWDIFSSSISVQVGASPVVDDLATQMGYEYESRVGDINGDGLDDILVQRTTSPDEWNGTIATVILQQIANGDFDSVIPTSAQVAFAQPWPIANIDIEVADVNMDGFVDLHIGNLESSIAGALNQFVFSSGQVLNPRPLDDIGVDDNFKQFVSDIQQWDLDHNYFDDNAIYVEEPGFWQFYYECNTYFWGPSPELECEWWFEWEDGDEYWSYAHFNQDAVEFADAMEEAENLGGLIEGSTQDQILTGIFDGLFGDVALGNIWAGAIATYPPISDTTIDTPWWRIMTRQLLLLMLLQMEGSTPPDANLYRVVGAAEYAVIVACHCFQPQQGQQDIKQFWKSPVDATWYAEEGLRIFYPGGILSEPRYMLMIRVPKTIISTGYHGTEPGTVFGWVSFSGPSLVALNTALATRPISLQFVFPPD